MFSRVRRAAAAGSACAAAAWACRPPRVRCEVPSDGDTGGDAVAGNDGASSGGASGNTSADWSSWYRRDVATLPRARTPLGGAVGAAVDTAGAASSEQSSASAAAVVDVAIVGGGFAGLHLAIELASRGKRVTVLEGGRVGEGASGKCGGFVSADFQLEYADLADEVGADDARTLLAWVRDALGTVSKRAEAAGCPIVPTPTLQVSRFRASESELQKFAGELLEANAAVGTRLGFVSRDGLRAMGLVSPSLHHAALDPESHAVNPLRLVLGLADLAERAGAALHENSRVVSVEPAASAGDNAKPGKAAATAHGNEENTTGSSSGGCRWVVRTSNGSAVRTGHVVLATGPEVVPAGLGDAALEHGVVAFHTYIGVTEPLNDEQQALFASGCMVFDDRFDLNYFRPVDSGRRLLWGGFCQAAPIPREDLPGRLERVMAGVFPPLRGVRVEHAWGGRIALARHTMPLVGQRKPGLWVCAGFAGDGIVASALGAAVVAEGICGESKRQELFERHFKPVFMGGPLRLAAASLYVRACIAAEAVEASVRDIIYSGGGGGGE